MPCCAEDGVAQQIAAESAVKTCMLSNTPCLLPIQADTCQALAMATDGLYASDACKRQPKVSSRGIKRADGASGGIAAEETELRGYIRQGHAKHVDKLCKRLSPDIRAQVLAG